MDDQDAERIQELAPQAIYKKIPANHVIHFFELDRYIEAIKEFAIQSNILKLGTDSTKQKSIWPLVS